MNINDIKIPTPFQISMDDIGWIEGRTPYWDDFMPTRTGIPRRHVLEDYKIINELGKSINMKICGMFIIGDWDRKGVLAKAPYSNKLGKEWKGSPCLNMEEEEEIRDYLNSSEYIELAIHGLLHESWDDNGVYMGAEFVPSSDLKAGDKSKSAPAPEWYIRAHLDAFMEIYNDWGFKQELRSFTCPGDCRDAWKNGYYTKIIKDYGVKYWHEALITHPFFDNGILLNQKISRMALWEAYDINPDKLPDYTEETAGIIGAHWPNFLRLDPDLNFENLEKWVRFFERQADVFGIIMSEDIAFAHKQLLIKKYYTIEEKNGRIKIDCSKADALSPVDFDTPIYISVKNGTAPFECEGGTMTVHSVRKGHTNYKIERNAKNNIYLK